MLRIGVRVHPQKCTVSVSFRGGFNAPAPAFSVGSAHRGAFGKDCFSSSAIPVHALFSSGNRCNGRSSRRLASQSRIAKLCRRARLPQPSGCVKQGLGKALPNKIPMGQNERTANYGTSVESCSVTSAYCLFQFLSSAVRSAEWENGGFAKLFPSANTTVTNPPRARFCGNFFIFPFATTTVKGPAFSKSGNKKSSKSFQTYCFCCRCDGRLLFSFGTM